MHRYVLLLLFALSTLIPATSTSAEFRTLPSGKRIEFLSLVHLTSGAGEKALMLKYRTEIPIENIAALEREADEIWAVFRFDVERTGLTIGILSANEPETSLLGSYVTANKSHQFGYQRSPGGAWVKMRKSQVEQEPAK